MAARGEEIHRKGFKKLQRRLKKKLPGTKFSLPASIAAEIRARVVDDVAWLHDTVQEIVFGTPPRGEEPAWADTVLKEVSKIVSKQGSGAEGESAEKAAWADVIEVLGLQFAAGRRGRVLLSRKPLTRGCAVFTGRRSNRLTAGCTVHGGRPSSLPQRAS
jgi:hypothetical protein